jgi:hypothetical protein
LLPSSNIYEALGWLDVCCSSTSPEEMKKNGGAQKPLRRSEHLPLDLNTSAASITLHTLFQIRHTTGLNANKQQRDT